MTQKLKALSLLVTLVLAATFTTGCKNNEGYVRNDANFLGIVEMRPGSYERIDSTTFDVHSDELSSRKDISGDNISILWGLVTLADY